MNSSFEKPFLKKQRIAINAKVVIPLTIILAFILIISALLDYWGTRRELSHILREQSQALITALEKGSQNAIASYDLVQSIVAERLLNNARLLEEMDFNGSLSESYLNKVADENAIFRINLFNAAGEKVMSSFQGRGWGAAQSASTALMARFANTETDELLLGFHSSRFGEGDRFAVAKKRRTGGVIVLNVNSEEMFEFRKSIGLGKLIREIGENEGIEYIALQDTLKIIIASAGVDSLSKISNEPALEDTYYSGIPSTRFITYKDKPLFEIIHLFDDENGELLRIGLSTSHIKEAQNSALTRAGLSSLLLLILGVIGMSWMISNQNVRSLKEAYTRMETYTGSMLENMTDAVVAVNGLGHITLVNKAAEHLFMVDEKAVLGKACEIEIVAICPYLKEALNTGLHKDYSEEQLQADKSITANLSVNVIKNEHGSPDIVFAVIRDVTDFKRLEDNLKRKDQITAMGHLASGVAHEIRNPLNAIGMIGQRLKSEFTPVDDKDEYSQLTSTVVTETRRINQIIQQFLHFARPAELVKTMADVSSIIADVSTMLRPQAEAQKINYIEKCMETPRIQIDVDKIKQVLLNLGQNAIDACHAGGLVEISCSAQNQSLVFEISDNGSGISKEDQAKIFNLYFTTKEHGTGIGLSLVQQIISQHNGTIEVQSEKQKGSTFIISLPMEL